MSWLSKRDETRMNRDSEEHYSTRIRRPNERDTRALANDYAREDSDRGCLARQVLRLLEWEADEECVCAETSSRNCPVHQDSA